MKSMIGPKEVVELLGGCSKIGKGVKTLADLDAAIHSGLPRSALDRVLSFAVPKSEQAKFRNRVIPRTCYQRSKR